MAWDRAAWVVSRRRFCGAFVGVLAAPSIAIAQASTRVRRIGWLVPGEQPPAATLEERKDRLKELGWIEGQNLIIERRYANNNPELLPALAAELVELNVDLMVTEGTAATVTAKNATTRIPIVMWSAGDPVRAGLIASLSRPGGNVTGNSLLSPEQDLKRLSLVRELLPGTQRVGELENSSNPYFRARRAHLEQAYRSVGMQPIFVEVSHARELEAAVADLARRRAQVLHVPSDDLFQDNAAEIMRGALRHALPTVLDRYEDLQAGGLFSYSFNVAELQRRGAAFIDKILRGAKPGELPVEQPTQFVLGVNLRTAKALGITFPRSLLLVADPNQVIQ